MWSDEVKERVGESNGMMFISEESGFVTKGLSESVLDVPAVRCTLNIGSGNARRKSKIGVVESVDVVVILEEGGEYASDVDGRGGVPKGV